MARHKLWHPASRWVKADWVPLLDVVVSIEDYIGDLRPLPARQLFPRWEAAVADLQQHLLAGKVRSSAQLYPEQGRPTVVALTAAFWRRFRIRSFSVSSSIRGRDKVGETADGREIWSQSVLLDDTRDGKEVRSPEDWRLFLHAADLGLLYPLGPRAEAAYAEVRVVEPVSPKEGKAAPAQPTRAPPGPEAKDDWRVRVKKYLSARAQSGERIPKAPEMLGIWEKKLGWEPDLREMQKVIRNWRLSHK